MLQSGFSPSADVRRQFRRILIGISPPGRNVRVAFIDKAAQFCQFRLTLFLHVHASAFAICREMMSSASGPGE